MISKKDKSSEYHATKALSASYMKLLKQSPAKCYWAMTHPTTPTADMIFGTYFHALVLEPEKEVNDFYVLQYKGTTKEGKAERKEAETTGKILVTLDDHDLAYAMRQSLESNDVWRALSGQSLRTEQSFYWEEKCGDFSVPCKARMDGVIHFEDETYIIDLKTTKDSSPSAIEKTIANYSAHLQAAWYIHALELQGIYNPQFIFFYVEKQPPYLTTPVSLSDSAIAIANDEIKGLIEKYAECEKNGWEQAYVPQGEVLTVDLPSWYK